LHCSPASSFVRSPPPSPAASQPSNSWRPSVARSAHQHARPRQPLTGGPHPSSSSSRPPHQPATEPGSSLGQTPTRRRRRPVPGPRARSPRLPAL
jgi:hypothetical protein